MTDSVDQKIPLAKRINNMELSEKVRLAMTGDKEARGLLIRNSNKLILANLIQNPRITDQEIMVLAKAKDLPLEILNTISKKKEWMKKYPLRLALVQNPRTPIPLGLKLLRTFRDQDVRKIARSKDVSTHIANAARKLLMSRGLL